MARSKKGPWLRISNMFPFKSDLKRMSTIVFYDNHYRVLTKGAPETIKTLLKEDPENYDKVYTHYTKQGYRVLALAWKELDISKVNLDDVSREEIEFDLKVK
jgi:manganese-transporting P-type ATPase